jgi:DNA-binding GntR family transcriptional regulator
MEGLGQALGEETEFARRGASVVELPAEFGIAASTAQKALAHLKAEGLIRAEVGLGPFVTEKPEKPTAEG